MGGLTSLFTNSALLWFLPLALIPVLLHLLTLHRLKTVELSTFRFLFDSYVQQRRRMKFLEWLIALLRTLFLLFLVFAISRMRTPDHWKSLFGGGAGSRDVVLMFDTSASMGAAAGDGRTALDRSREAAGRVLEQLKPGDHVTMIRVGERPEQLLRRFQASTEEIKNEIDNLETAPSRGNLYAAFSQLF
ncbi:MAG: vWA domain-containing protein, partial [Planctomycetota bacterium]|nr:vWA domain-containing protein [Planctomycetota bacterium]